MRRSWFAVVVGLAACMPNPYAKFYEGLPNARVREDYEPSSAPLQLFSSNDFDRDILELERRGYSVIGSSSFNASLNNVRESQLRSHAQAIGAQLVLLASRYTNTVSGAVPLSMPKTSTTTSSGTATAYGPGGSVTAVGSGTSTTYGSETVLLPYSVARGDFTALYFVRTQPVLGLIVVALDDTTRMRIQSNFGVRVAVVVDGSPAFDAEILPGDILLQIGNERLHSDEQYGQLITAHQGERVELILNRGGREIRKTVVLRTIRRP